MSDYIVSTVGRTLWAGTLLVGIPLIVARLLQKIGFIIDETGFLKCVLGYHWCGRFYLYFVAIGVACHETGHAIGAWMTGNRVTEFVPFRLDSPEHPDWIGWIYHTVDGGVWGRISEAIICTGPLWFGGLVILLLTRFLIGQEMIVSFYDYFADGELPGLFSYLVACLRCAFLLCCEIARGMLFSGWKFFLWAYLVFCVASNMGMSRGDLKLARLGLLLIFGMVLALLLFPITGRWIAVVVAVLLPKFFIIHVLMILAVFINTVFLFLERLVVRIT